MKYGTNTLQVFKDYMKAKDLQCKSVARARQNGHRGVILHLDHNVAIRCLSKAVELGSVEALVELARIAKANYCGIWMLEHEGGKAISGQELIDSF